jgi:GDP-4-dehydro-6-deoxy-D-mannose reductase
MKVLVTGAKGFVGKNLVVVLLERGHEVVVSERDPDTGTAIKLDVTDSGNVLEALQQVRPDAIIHLAAQTHVPTAWAHPQETVMVNTMGTLHIINAIKTLGLRCKVLNIGSSEEYGHTGKSGEPLTESMACQPQNPYAVSKFAAGQLAVQVGGQYGIKVIHVRPFNHYGPEQREGFVVSDFVAQIAKMEQGLQPHVLRVGNLSAQRDFTYISDVVSAYIAMLESDIESGIYNVCSGNPIMVGDILEALIAMAQVKIETEVDPLRLRPSDVPYFVGSNAKLSNKVGWGPKVDFENGLFRTLEWWRSQA